MTTDRADPAVPLLHTKLHRPPVTADLVCRSRLHELLDGAFAAPLALVSAPAGYGKTILQVQTIDEFKMVYTTALGTELNFKDTYKTNISACRLAKLLGLDHMVPPSVERRFRGDSAAVTWWVDDVLMTEKQRFFAKKRPPDPDHWNRQMYVVRVFDQLIYNMDRNLGNLVIDKNWNLYMIDHTRAFRLHKKLRNEENLMRCDRGLFTALQALNRNSLRQELRQYLTNGEIDAVLARRDLIVRLFKDQAAQKGDAAVFYH